MPTLEWIGSFQNLPHQFTSSANEALQIAKIVEPSNGLPKWSVLVGKGDPAFPQFPDGLPRSAMPQPVYNPANGHYEYPPTPSWTIDNVFIGDKTLNQIFNNAPAPPSGPGVATPWVGGPNDPQIYFVPPVVPIIGGGTPVEPTVPTVDWWIDLIDRVNAAAANGTLTAAGLQDAITRLSALPQPRPGVAEAKIADWGYILSNHLLDPGGGFTPVRVVVEGRGRMVYNQGELNQALAAGGYIEHLDGTGGTVPPLAGSAPSSSTSLLTWGVIAAAALYALRKSK